MMSHSTDQYCPVIPPRPWHTRPNPIQELFEPNSQIFSPQPWRIYPPLFPVTTEWPSPLSSHFQASFAWQMEAIKLLLCPDPNEFTVPVRTLSNLPVYLSPTIEEIEQLTLDSGPRHDMGSYVMDDVYVSALWNHIQQNLYTAQPLCWNQISKIR